MNVFTVLRGDHERVSSILKQIQRGFGQADTPERDRLFRQLKREVELHAAVEDLHVYRVFQQARRRCISMQRQTPRRYLFLRFQHSHVVRSSICLTMAVQRHQQLFLARLNQSACRFEQATERSYATDANVRPSQASMDRTSQ